MSISRDIDAYMEAHHPEKLKAYQGLKYGIKDIAIVNPLKGKDAPELQLARMVMDPSYAYFTCKYILGQNIMPFQGFCVKELYNHARPLVIASRGFGKCLVGDTLIVTNFGVQKIKDILPKDYVKRVRYLDDNIKILGANGYSELDYAWSNGETDTSKIKTNYGFDLEGTLDHPVKIIGDGQIIWKELKDVKVGDKIVIYRNPIDHKNNSGLEEDEAYLLGLIIGDGCYSQECIIFTSADKELSDKAKEFSLKYFGKSFVDVKSDKIGFRLYSKRIRDELLSKYKFNSSICAEKDVPSLIYESSNEVIEAFIRGLFDTDGCCLSSHLEFCAKSSNLVKNLQILLLKLGIVSRRFKKHNKKYNTDYHYLYIGSNDAVKFKEKIGFGLTRKQEKLEKLCQKTKNPNKDVIPKELILNRLLSLRDKYVKIRQPMSHSYNYKRQLLSPHRLKAYDLSYSTLHKILELTNELSNDNDWKFLKEIYNKNYFYDTITEVSNGSCETFDVHLKTDHSFVSNGFISHNTYLFGLYAVYKAFLDQGSKIIVVGSGFRQSKMIMEACEKVWHSADVLRDIIGLTGLRGEENGVKYAMDKITMTIGESEITALPIGVGGQKIRGFRSNCTIADEFDSHDLDIFERVVRGFGVVSDDPAEKVRIEMAKKAALKLGISPAKMGLNFKESFNQEIIGGTCSYSFSNLGQYFKKYRAIIEARGEEEKLKALMPEDYENFKDVNPAHYCVFRVPYDMLPKGYMSETDIISARATSSSDIFNSEFGCIFLDDSAGFFKKSLIDSCVTNERINGIQFPPALRGKKDAEYVIGVDPASESDNFAIVVTEVYKSHKRVIACFTTSRKKFNKDKADSKTLEKRFYSYAAKKIRRIMEAFGNQNVIQIGMDADGGGRAIADEMKTLENPVYEIIVPGEIKDTDIMVGPHIIKLIKFQDYQWVSTANHTMKRDLENKNLLFPQYDPYAMVAEEELDGKNAGFIKYEKVKLLAGETVEDTIDYIYDEIELLKKELTSIVCTQTPGGREKWGLPTKKGETQTAQNTQFKKDRYSALLIANAVANEVTKSRESDTTPDKLIHGVLADKALTKKNNKQSSNMFYGSNPMIGKLNAFKVGLVKKGDR